ncbi:glycosyltransferase family 4 protein [Psychroserpens sp.]
MDSRKRVGLVFSYNENWIAGAYYILNVIHALNTLSDEEKPIIVVLAESRDNFLKVKEDTNYPYLDFEVFPFRAKYSFAERAVNKLGRILLKKQIILKKQNTPKLDFLYPKQINKLQGGLLKVNWIPDFQEDHLPQYFSKEEILSRKQFQKEVVANGDVVVLSSQDAKNDFIRLYPNARAVPFVLRFAVTHPHFYEEQIETLICKHNLDKNYFFAPNQFWAHKNHIIILKAVKYLKNKGIKVTVAMSGKQDDYRNKENFNNLTEYIKGNDLSDYVKFLGFLPREEQLCLFKNAIAIIQPSLFEGWSTVVEDSKCLNKFIILSNIDVHKEQVTKNVAFFDPNDAEALAGIIEKNSVNHPVGEVVNYKENVIEFGKQFLNLLNFEK